MDWIKMAHPDLESTAEEPVLVSVKAFESAHILRGWYEIDEELNFVRGAKRDEEGNPVFDEDGNVVIEYSAPVLDVPTPPEEDVLEPNEE